MKGALIKLGLGTMFGAILIRSVLIFIKSHVPEQVLTADDVVGNVPVQRDLQEFVDDLISELQFIKVTDRVTSAFGVSYANSIIIDAPEGLIIVDTVESPRSAAVIVRELRKFNKKPVKAIVYTHFHGDHIQGAEAFIEDKDNPPDIWAFHTLPDIINSNLMVGRRGGYGMFHQFGVALGKAQLWPNIPNGLQVFVPILPNKLIYHEYESYNIAGMNVSFVHIPGETEDHLAVWLPEERVLMPADNIYRAFPNIYAIRGIPHRDTLTWSHSLRKMRSLNADHLVPSHMRPVSGRKEIYDLLTIYESAIRLVHDQTVRHMNELRHPDDIAQRIRLPPHMAAHPYLKEFYGKVEWTSKSIYQRYVGWFSGDPVELQPLTPTERSQRIADMVGVDRLLTEAEVALKTDDTQWALELASHVLRLDGQNLRAKYLQLEILRAKAAQQTNPGARNYFLTAALVSQGMLNIQVDWMPVMEKLDLEILLRNLMTVRLKAELTHGVNLTIYLRLEDVKEMFRLQILHSVLTVDVVPFNTTASGDGQAVVATRDQVWKGVMFGKLPAATAYTSGELKVTGSLDSLKQFLAYF